ncbi:MAG: TPM domain-containing protein [Oribacterium sp.]|nr:TPM domain-containing protein [Oribacterium sp.]
MLKNKSKLLGLLLTDFTLRNFMKQYKANEEAIRNNRFSAFVRAVFGMILLIFIFASESLAGEVKYTNPETQYVVYIDDAADLLTDDEEYDLVGKMTGITEYGNAAFVTNEEAHSNSTTYYTEERYQELFDWDSGTMFMIDMADREIFIHSDGEVYSIVNNDRAETITDNAYRLAGKGDYYGCASLVFEQIQKVLEGGRIAQPMKYTSNAVLAIILALLINYGLLAFSRRAYKREIKSDEVLVHAVNSFILGASVESFLRQTKRYIPPSSSGGGGHSGGGGGHHSSGGGGGGHHGGGGGHRF